jgi:hypothetical protein
LKIYINGILDITYSLGDTIRSDSNPYLYIGVRGDESVEFFNGIIDEVRVWNK